MTSAPRPARAALALALALALVACGGDEASTDESGRETEAFVPLARPEEPAPPPPDRGPDGALLESSESVLGLRLPRGLTAGAVIDREHHYEGPYAPELYARYFGPRLTTGTVDRTSGGGARYVAAVPRDVRGGAVAMDVIIAPGPEGSSRVTIIELPLAPQHPPDEAETIRRAEEALRGAR